MSDLLRLLAAAHPDHSQGDLLAMLEDIPDRASQKPAQRRVGSRPRSPASMERRRSWAAAGRLPPALASRFTLAEQAVLAVVSMEAARHGACTLTIGHLAAVAGVSETTVRNAMRAAVALSLVRVEERRLTAWRNAPNRVTIVSPEWSSWLRLRPKGGGCKSVQATPTRIHTREPSKPTDLFKRAAKRQGDRKVACAENRTGRW